MTSPPQQRFLGVGAPPTPDEASRAFRSRASPWRSPSTPSSSVCSRACARKWEPRRAQAVTAPSYCSGRRTARRARGGGDSTPRRAGRSRLRRQRAGAGLVAWRASGPSSACGCLRGDASRRPHSPGAILPWGATRPALERTREVGGVRVAECAGDVADFLSRIPQHLLSPLEAHLLDDARVGQACPVQAALERPGARPHRVGCEVDVHRTLREQHGDDLPYAPSDVASSSRPMRW